MNEWPNGATGKSDAGREGGVGSGEWGGEEREERGGKEAYFERLDEVRLAVEQNRALVGADVDVARI